MQNTNNLIEDDIRMTEYRLTFPLAVELRKTLEAKLAGLRRELEAGQQNPQVYRRAA